MTCQDRNKVYKYALVSSVCLLVALVGLIVSLLVLEVMVIDGINGGQANITSPSSKSLDSESNGTPLRPNNPGTRGLPNDSNITTTTVPSDVVTINNPDIIPPVVTTTTTTITTSTSTTTTKIKNHQKVICDDNWIDANQVHLGCLSLNNLSKMRYSEAKTYCKSIHSHLVEVQSEAAMRFVVQQLRSLGLRDLFWGGAAVEGGVWRWTVSRAEVARLAWGASRPETFATIATYFSFNCVNNGCYGAAYDSLYEGFPVCQYNPVPDPVQR